LITGGFIVKKVVSLEPEATSLRMDDLIDGT